MGALAAAYGADPFLGAWIFNPAKSDVKRGLLVEYAMDGDRLKYSSGGVEYAARFDGRASALIGLSTHATVSLKRLDDHRVEATYKRGETVVNTSTLVVSPDGRLLTVTSVSTRPNGERPSLINVYQKISGTQEGDPLLGTWERNPMKSLGNAQAQIRYEAEGSGVKFSGGHIEYSAGFDGRDYPVRGSVLSDTVSLKRVESHVLEEIWKAGGKVVNTVRRVVSPDGRVMTATATGTTPQGDPFSDVYVYDKAAP